VGAKRPGVGKVTGVDGPVKRSLGADFGYHVAMALEFQSPRPGSRTALACPWTKPSMAFVHWADRWKRRGFPGSPAVASCSGRLVPQSVSLAVVMLFLAASSAPGQAARSKPVRRAAPPPAWDAAAVSGTFLEDAFTGLQGERPDFKAMARGSAGPAAAAGPEEAGAGAGRSGFKWSALVSEETLTDEIKDMKGVIATAAARPTDFKGGGYDKAREAFSSVALAFGVIAAYDLDIRWKKDAATARDLFARAGFNCKTGTDQSFAESKARLADLEAMLDGGAPDGKPDRDEDFQWSQVAARPALMSRLESADEVLAATVANKSDFDRKLDRVVHEAEIVAAIGEAIQRKNFEFHDDDTYRGYAAAMRDAGIAARDAARKKDYDAARTAVGAVKKSCAACHGDYRG